MPAATDAGDGGGGVEPAAEDGTSTALAGDAPVSPTESPTIDVAQRRRTQFEKLFANEPPPLKPKWGVHVGDGSVLPLSSGRGCTDL